MISFFAQNIEYSNFLISNPEEELLSENFADIEITFRKTPFYGSCIS